MAVAMTALGWVALAGMQHSIRSTVDGQLAIRGRIVQNLVAAFPPEHSPDRLKSELRENLGPDSKELLVRISDEAGNIPYQSDWLARHDLPVPAHIDEAEHRHKPFFDSKVAGDPYRGVSLSVASGGHIYAIVIAQNMDDFEEATSRFHRLLLTLIPLWLLAASAGGYWMSRKAMAPVDEITRTAQKISAQNLSARLAVPESGDELARLAETLNAMLERLDQAMKQITQFTADASHELRTPIALMRTRAELALRRPRSPEENQETIAELHNELLRTSELVERLMLLARADSGVSMLRIAPVELAQLAGEVLRQTSVLAQQKGLEVEAALGKHSVWVQGDAQFLRQLVTILIDNAVKYTTAPGRITVGLHASSKAASILVSDTGIGIEADDLQKIFERFYRADKARSRHTGGIGLGLAIGRWIAEAHGGTLAVESQPGKGSTFRLNLPLIH
jgi:heavy metal sensor kinase